MRGWQFGIAVVMLSTWEIQSAQAANLQISSTRLLLTPERPIASINIRNSGEGEVAVQAEVLAWSQDENGRDVFQPTRDVLANPTIFRITSNSMQVLRLGLQIGRDVTERSYRLFLQELPHEPIPGQIQTLLRFSLPIFVPGSSSSQDLQWQMIAESDDSGVAVLSNRGATHIQVTGLTVRSAAGAVLTQQKLSAYVLPGRSRCLPVSVPHLRAGETVRVEVSTDAADEMSSIAVQVSNAGTLTP